jgi:hypothetical protein
LAAIFVCLLITGAELGQCLLEAFRKNVSLTTPLATFLFFPKFKLVLKGQRFDDIIIKK